MKSNILIILILLISTLSFSQDDLELTLRRGSRTIGLSNKDTYICDSKINAQGDSVFYTYEGEILDVNKDSIIMIPWETSQTIFYKDKRTLETSKVYTDDKISRVSINVNNVSLVTHQGTFLSNFLLGIAVSAAGCAVLVAPLASINYKDKTFDTKNYATINGISSLVFFPCLLVSLNIDEKKYRINTGKRSWTIVR